MTHLKMACRQRVCNVNTVNRILLPSTPPPPPSAVTPSRPVTLYRPLHLFVMLRELQVQYCSWSALCTLILYSGQTNAFKYDVRAEEIARITTIQHLRLKHCLTKCKFSFSERPVLQ
jgi:hypothetical protein